MLLNINCKNEKKTIIYLKKYSSSLYHGLFNRSKCCNKNYIKTIKLLNS